MVERSWTKVGGAHVFSSSILCDNFCELTLYTLHFLHPKVQIKTKNMKVASIRNIYMTVKLKTKMLYVDVKILYKPVTYV